MEQVALWSLILLNFSMASAIGGGLYEHIVLTPIWSASPPSSFTIIQPRTGVRPSTILDSRARGHHHLHSRDAPVDLG
jgi:hypothetical protein